MALALRVLRANWQQYGLIVRSFADFRQVLQPVTWFGVNLYQTCDSADSYTQLCQTIISSSQGPKYQSG